jgi:hypothetical protein
MKPTITPSDLRRQAETMIADGTMPDLATVLKAISETREKYTDRILAAREDGIGRT